MPDLRNDRNSDRYREISRANLNQPVTALVCPRCEGRDIVRDDGTDHPGCFECADCGHLLTA